jgi:adenylosuccinate lyase
MLNRFTGLIDKLVVYPERMLANLGMTKGVIFSQMVLLKLIEKGISREGAYAIVQRNAMKSWREGLEFQDLLLSDGEVTSRLKPVELAAAFKVENFLTQVDFIFGRVFGEKP